MWQNKIGNYESVFALLTTHPPPTRPAKNLKNQNFEKMKKLLEISFYTCVPRYGCNHTIFCHFGSFFALLPHYWPQILKIEKKIRRYFLFHMYTINKDSWDIRHNRQKFLSFWAIFCPFIPLTNQKIKIFKKWKKPLKILSFYICLPRMTIIWCTVPEIWSSAGNFLILDHFLPFYCKFKILKKKPGDIISLHLCTTNDNHMMYGSLDIRCNGQSFL